jgi:hypothetical protein
MDPPFLECSVPAEIASAPQSLVSPTFNHETEMDRETEARTIRLTSQIIRCIAKSLLASAEELESSLWHYSTPTDHSQSSSECDDALKL